MSIYRVAIEWTAEDGGRKAGYVFFEADSQEQAKAQAPLAVEFATLGQKDVKHDDYYCAAVAAFPISIDIFCRMSAAFCCAVFLSGS
jgi:hypothetical protein